ncbi:HEAT repeat domain-containing protein [Planctomycetota bacterium]
MTEQTKPIETPEPERKNNALRLSLWVGIPAVLMTVTVWVLYAWLGYWACALQEKPRWRSEVGLFLLKWGPRWALERGIIEYYPVGFDEKLLLNIHLYSDGYTPGQSRLVHDPDGIKKLMASQDIETQKWAKVHYIKECIFGDKTPFPLDSYIQDRIPEVRCYALWWVPEEEKRTIAARMLNDTHPGVRKQAALRLIFIKVKGGDDWELREDAKRASLRPYVVPILRARLEQERNKIVSAVLIRGIKLFEESGQYGKQPTP